MKQSEDQNTIIFGGGLQLKAKLAEGCEGGCEGCYFQKFPYEVYCERIACTMGARDDLGEVIFVEVKNENQ